MTIRAVTNTAPGFSRHLACQRTSAAPVKQLVWDTLIPEESIKDTVIRINVTKVVAKFWLQFLCLANG
jgi:hypothetical protein